MPISIDYDRKENVLYTITKGVIKLDVVMSFFLSATTLDLKPGYRILADCSGAILQLSNEDIQKITARRQAMKTTTNKIKVAVFCNTDLVFGVGRMYQALLDSSEYSVMIFRCQKEAMKWLGM